VSVRDLRVTFASRERTVHAVNGVSFDLAAGEVLGILGESGSGKSVTLRALIGLLPPAQTRIEGDVRIAGRDLTRLAGKPLADFRGRTIAMIFQEPMTALDPVYTIGAQIEETIVRHEGVSHKAARARALELLDLVQIPSPARRLAAYPHEMSGGMRQRAMIALALSCRPSILLADEPTTALDVTVQIQIILLLRRLQREAGHGGDLRHPRRGRVRRDRRPPRRHVRGPLRRDRAHRGSDPPAAASVHGGAARLDGDPRRGASACPPSRARRPISARCPPAAPSLPAAATPRTRCIADVPPQHRSPPTTPRAACARRRLGPRARLAFFRAPAARCGRYRSPCICPLQQGP
jgi:ABC-type dipeptide/oligopeptide/nickel transport system ATPase subunit